MSRPSSAAALRSEEARPADETQATLVRLESRIADQEARIEALYRMLEMREADTRAGDSAAGDALADERWEIVDVPSARRRRKQRTRRRARFHVGTATGV